MLAGTEKALPGVSGSLRALLEGLIDYAGLFPPAKLPMEEALRKYDVYSRGEHAWMLGRFVVPASRLHEVPEHFPVSVLIEELAHIPPDVDTIEVKGKDIAAIARAAEGRTTYVEVQDESLLDAIAAHGLRAKIRTGGVTADAFPSAEAMARFIRACMTKRVAFKATAGLHHPLRCVKPLTYEKNAPTGTMHGFLNVFLAAALPDPSPTLGVTLLEDSDPGSFSFADDAATWRGHRVTAQQIAEMRKLAISFGSCSFEEPVADLRELGWL